MNWKFISGLILIIILIIYILFYPLQFEFYENCKAKRIADFAVIAIFFILILYDLYRNIKKGKTNWKKYFLDFGKGLVLFFIAYFFILRVFFSSGILFINSVFGEKETVVIRGIIIEKTDIKGGGKFTGTYELKINQEGDEFIFDSKHTIIENYKVNEYFEMEMKKGILNLLYK